MLQSLPQVTIFSAIYLSLAVALVLLDIKLPHSRVVSILTGVLIVVGMIDLRIAFGEVDAFGISRGFLVASAPIGSCALVFAYLVVFKRHGAERKPMPPSDKLVSSLFLMFCTTVLCFAVWSHVRNVRNLIATERFSKPIQASASILGKFLQLPIRERHDVASYAIPLLAPQRFIIVEQLDSRGSPDLKHLLLSRIEADFPSAREGRDVDSVVMVLGETQEVRRYANAGPDYQWGLECYIVDLKGGTVRARSGVMAGSRPDDRTGRPNAGDSSFGSLPWAAVKSWVRSFVAG